MPCARRPRSSSGPSSSTRSGRTPRACCACARKRSTPGKIPFPLLHVDTGFKFREMYEFRDRTAREVGAELHRVAQRGGDRRRGPTRSPSAPSAAAGSSRPTPSSRACATSSSTPPSAGPAATRSGRAPRSDCSPSATSTASGIPGTSARSCGACSTPGWPPRVHPGLPAVQLDRARRVAVHLPGGDPGQPAVLRAGSRRRWSGTGSSSCSTAPFGPGRPTGPARRADGDGRCRFRSLGCVPCSGAVRSTAATLEAIIEEVRGTRTSERGTRVIDHDADGSMERKKREGYF